MFPPFFNSQKVISPVLFHDNYMPYSYLLFHCLFYFIFLILLYLSYFSYFMFYALSFVSIRFCLSYIPVPFQFRILFHRHFAFNSTYISYFIPVLSNTWHYFYVFISMTSSCLFLLVLQMLDHKIIHQLFSFRVVILTEFFLFFSKKILLAATTKFLYVNILRYILIQGSRS